MLLRPLYRQRNIEVTSPACDHGMSKKNTGCGIWGNTLQGLSLCALKPTSFESQKSKQFQVTLDCKFLVIHSFQTNGFGTGPGLDSTVTLLSLLDTKVKLGLTDKPQQPLK